MRLGGVPVVTTASSSYSHRSRVATSRHGRRRTLSLALSESTVTGRRTTRLPASRRLRLLRRRVIRASSSSSSSLGESSSDGIDKGDAGTTDEPTKKEERRAASKKSTLNVDVNELQLSLERAQARLAAFRAQEALERENEEDASDAALMSSSVREPVGAVSASSGLGKPEVEGGAGLRNRVIGWFGAIMNSRDEDDELDTDGNVKAEAKDGVIVDDGGGSENDDDIAGQKMAKTKEEENTREEDKEENGTGSKSTDKPAPNVQGGWFRWTDGWRVSESIENITSASWIPGSGGVVRQAESEENADDSGDEIDLLQRVPLPPWIRQRMFGKRSDPSSSSTAAQEKGEDEEDVMAYKGTISMRSVDSAIRDASATAMNVTAAAVDKLDSAIQGIEKVEETALKEGKFQQDSVALKILQETLKDARASADEARQANQALEAAVREVTRVQEGLKAGLSGEDAFDALEQAKAAVVRQATSSNAAVADALKQLSYIATRIEQIGGDLVIDDAATQSSKSQRRGLMGAISNARRSAQDALVASELTQTVARLTSFAKGDDSAATRKSQADELSEMVKPALQKVVANALTPVNDDEINSARLACSLSAWVYYLPQMQHALPRNGLRLITSSLDVNEVIPSATFRKGKNLVEDSVERAEREWEHTLAAAQASAKKDAVAEMEATKLAAEAAERAADAFRVAAELKVESGADSEAAQEKTRIAKQLALEAKSKLDAASEISAANKRKIEKWKMQYELAELENQMQKTVIEQQKKMEAERLRTDRIENASLPVNFCVAAQDETATLWVVVEGSTNFASWQANLTFQPVTFEDESLGVHVHRGAYTAAKTMYRRVEQAVKEHVAKHGARARVRITGHSIGGSIASILGLMLLVRNGAPRYALADIWAFGAPYVMSGGDALLARLGLPRTFMRIVMMGDDVVPRSFSCYYPRWARSILETAPGPFNVDTSGANFLDEQMFYVPMGDLYMLQAMNGDPHPLLPPGPGLYVLDGDGVYEMLATRARQGEDVGDDEAWLNRRRSVSDLMWYDGDDSESDSDSEETNDNLGMNQLACLTQSDAALTASLIVSHIKADELLEGEGGGIVDVLNERSRDAAQRVLMNTPHPLTILSKPAAYGDHGIISRHHNPFNYSKALSNARKMKNPSSSSRKPSQWYIDGAPATRPTDPR